MLAKTPYSLFNRLAEYRNITDVQKKGRIFVCSIQEELVKLHGILEKKTEKIY